MEVCMQLQEIPAQQWGPFLETISRRHQGEKISLEMQKPDRRTQSETQEVQLIGITFDLKQSIGNEIDVMVRSDRNAQLTHAIVRPSHLRISRTEEGVDFVLQVESADGLVTLVRFNSRDVHPSAPR